MGWLACHPDVLCGAVGANRDDDLNALKIDLIGVGLGGKSQAHSVPPRRDGARDKSGPDRNRGARRVARSAECSSGCGPQIANRLRRRAVVRGNPAGVGLGVAGHELGAGGIDRCIGIGCLRQDGSRLRGGGGGAFSVGAVFAAAGAGFGASGSGAGSSGGGGGGGGASTSSTS